MEIFFGKFAVDLDVERFRHKEGPTSAAGLHFDGANLLFTGDLKELFRADLMPQIGRIFGTSVYAGPTADTLVMGVLEGPQIPQILRLKGTGWATHLAGGATRALPRVELCPVKQRGCHEDHRLTAQQGS